MRVTTVFFSALIALALPSTVLASAPTGAGDWDAAPFPDRCLTVEDFDGPGETQLVLALELDGSSSLMLTNAGWSSVADQQYPSLAVLVNGNVYDGAGGVGVEVLGRKGFAMNMPAEFLNDVAAGRALDVYLGDQVVDSLSLTGSADGVSALRRCIVGVRREHEAAERERRRFEGLPRDPFAPKHTGN